MCLRAYPATAFERGAQCVWAAVADSYIPITAAEYAAEAAQYMPADEAAAMAGLFAKVLDGRNSRPTSGVQDALGREPADFAEYAKRAAATGIWPAA